MKTEMLLETSVSFIHLTRLLPGNILLNPVAAKASDHTKSSSSPP
jgi:hypothetical protein